MEQEATLALIFKGYLDQFIDTLKTLIGVVSDTLEFCIEPLNGLNPIDRFGNGGKAELHEGFEAFFQSGFPSAVELNGMHISELDFPENARIRDRSAMGE